METEVVYLPDCDVNESLDGEIRGLLTACFCKPEDEVFRHRRYFVEPYPHRWVIRAENGMLAAHIGVHEKTVRSGGLVYAIAGMAEVCTHPDVRGRGYVRIMLQTIHQWLQQRTATPFAVLFGDPLVYSSSGYVVVDNLIYGSDEKGWTSAQAMVHTLTAQPWPEDTVQLPGPKF